jgi:hypothetical protein
VNDRGFARTFGCVPKRDPLQAKSDAFQTKFVDAVQIWSREDGIYSSTCLSANDVISVSTVSMSRKATYGISTSRADDLDVHWFFHDVAKGLPSV